jgi:predicted flavoprotein YhiN
MHKTAYWLFPLIAIAVAVFIILFFIEINQVSTVESKNTEVQLTKSLVLEDDKGSWISRLSQIHRQEYLYPVNEVSLEISPMVQSESIKQYRLNVKLASSYEFFCLKQELEKTKLSYLLNQSSDSMSVEIDSSDLVSLNNLINKLKMYQISATLSPLKKD